MPKHKDLKRLVRTRMRKTGESYTTARAHITRGTKPPAPVPVSEYANLAGMSDDAVRTKTGRTWKQWVSVLDAIDAWRLPHRDIARHIRESYDVSSWWSQTVTVGYERIRGLRDIGQRRGGTYEAGKSRTYPVPVRRLYRAFADVRNRRRWLDEADELRVRTATVEKSMRISWPDGTSIHVSFSARTPEKSTVVVQHVALPNRAAVERAKADWAARLDTLGAFLG